ncbi:serine/threonine-protein kinase [Actinoplanes sp. NPDC051851]|uniref:serine/threonine protein kinase n=1 Tax=Actinoplanes sp. NPDC051851 TaxID=3154753 RepID=UPI0034495106
MADPLRSTDPPFIGRYRTLSRLGQGGMGAVYLAEAPGGRLVAIKVIRPEYAHEEHFRARFRSEVNRARQVPPFCTAEVLDADPDHQTPYLVVEYVDGPTLNEVVEEQGSLTGGNLHGVAVGVAAALAAIHGAGVIHRDLKPRNVLFALGTPKVIDFGIARPLEPTSFHTRAEEMVGTLAYMAPERFDPETDRLLTPAADVFAWGAVVTYAGTGRTPFGGDSPAATAARILTQPPRLTDLPPYLTALVSAALEKDPADRPTAPELLDRLLVTGSGPSAPPLPVEIKREAEAAQQSGRYRTSGTRTRPGRRRTAMVATATAVVAATALAVVGAAALRSHAEPAAQGSVAEPSASASAPAAAATVAGPSVFDALRAKDGAFEAKTGDSGACAHQNGLRVTAKAGDVMPCGSWLGTVFPSSQNATVDATLANSRSCAAIWFRASSDVEDDYFADAYRVALCPDTVTLISTIDGFENVIATERLATTIGEAHRIQVVTADQRATVAVDGTAVLEGELTESSLISGRVLLGAVAPESGRAVVTFTDAELRSGGDTGTPGTPAFLTGDAQFTAGFYYLHDAHRVGILEPSAFYTGAEYCAKYALADTSPQCTKSYVPVASATRVVLPTVAKVEYLDFRNQPKKCLDATTHTGLCPVTAEEFRTFSGAEPSPWPALVTIRDGEIVSVAMLDYSVE